MERKNLYRKYLFVGTKKDLIEHGFEYKEWYSYKNGKLEKSTHVFERKHNSNLIEQWDWKLSKFVSIPDVIWLMTNDLTFGKDDEVFKEEITDTPQYNDYYTISAYFDKRPILQDLIKDGLVVELGVFSTLPSEEVKVVSEQ